MKLLNTSLSKVVLWYKIFVQMSGMIQIYNFGQSPSLKTVALNLLLI